MALIKQAHPAVDNAIALIDEIGTVEYTAESKALIDAAKAAYNALTAEQQALVSNYTTLTEAEAAELNGKMTVSGADARFVKNADTGAILLEVTGVEAKDMGKIITIDMGDYGTIEFCGNDFARMMANSDNASIAALGAALYLYGAKADACFA